IGVPLKGHEDSVLSVAFSPDGTRIVSGSHDDTIRIWDATTGAQIGDPLKGHEHLIWSVAFSPDGTRIVSGSDDHTIRIWDATTGAQIGDPLKGDEDSVLSVAFSPDQARIVSGLHDNTIRTMDANTNYPIYNTLINHHQSFQGSVPISSVHNWCLPRHVAHNHWHLSSDGWIIFPHLPHGIIWIPPQFRKPLWRPQNTCIISQTGYTKISLEYCVYGEEWFHCIED
ncbi:WD40 repeat-like protein, partial [Gymnopus androsaceus JB14]